MTVGMKPFPECNRHSLAGTDPECKHEDYSKTERLINFNGHKTVD